MDQSLLDLFDRSDALLARSKAINRSADVAYLRLRYAKARCDSTRNLPRSANNSSVILSNYRPYEEPEDELGFYLRA